MNRKQSALTIILVALILLLGVTVYGAYQSISIGNGFLFIPSVTVTPSLTNTPTLTSTPTVIPSATIDIAQIRTQAILTYEAGALSETQSSLLATQTAIPDIPLIQTEAIQEMLVNLTKQAISVSETEQFQPKINEQGAIEQRLGLDLSLMIKIETDQSIFWIDKYEVSNEQFQKYVDSGACSQINAENPIFSGLANELAITHVSWSQASAYCQWVGKRLPTMKEWQIVASAGEGYQFPWGNDPEGLEFTNASMATGGPQVVSSNPKSISAGGVYNLMGNVWEWVDSGESMALAAEQNHTIVGGGWRTFAGDLSADLVGEMGKDEIADDVGFRCVLDS